jgi:hypothetical protein
MLERVAECENEHPANNDEMDEVEVEEEEEVVVVAVEVEEVEEEDEEEEEEEDEIALEDWLFLECFDD